MSAPTPSQPAPTAGAVEISHGVTVRQAHYAPHQVIGRHSHPWGYIALVTQGLVHEECVGEAEVRASGAVRIIPAGVPHANAYGATGATCMVVAIEEAAAGALAERGARFDAPATWAAGSGVSMLARRMLAELRAGDSLSPLAMDGLMRELIAMAARASAAGRAPASPPRWLLQARDRLHDELADPPRLLELAAGAGVHPSHLVRMFRRHFHAAPAEYLAHVRIERARSLLAATSERISTIAFMVGFSDQAHFTRRFRAITGTTPARYRSAVRERAD